MVVRQWGTFNSQNNNTSSTYVTIPIECEIICGVATDAYSGAMASIGMNLISRTQIVLGARRYATGNDYIQFARYIIIGKQV